jgi:hypothetical protein
VKEKKEERVMKNDLKENVQDVEIERKREMNISSVNQSELCMI